MLLSVPCKDSEIDVMRVSGHLERTMRCLKVKVGHVLKMEGNGYNWLTASFFFGDVVLII